MELHSAEANEKLQSFTHCGERMEKPRRVFGGPVATVAGPPVFANWR